MRTLLPRWHSSDSPKIDSLDPGAAMPGGIVDLRGSGLAAGLRPEAMLGGLPMRIAFSSAGKLSVIVPEGAISGTVSLQTPAGHSNNVRLSVATPLAGDLHPVGNPAVDRDGNLYTTFSGARGQEVPVSIFRIGRDFELKPFVRGLMNATGLALGPDGYLYCSSRAEGTVYRISAEGGLARWAEGMGIATGLAFDRDGNLYVGDRSGTIFKLNAQGDVFVFATLEPSVSAYHLAFNDAGTLFVSGPTTSSNECIHAISPEGEVRVWYRGLGRPQGMAVDVDGNLYVAASLRGERGIVRITPSLDARLVLSGNRLVGIAFLEDGAAALTTTDGIFHVDLGVTGRLLQ